MKLIITNTTYSFREYEDGNPEVVCEYTLALRKARSSGDYLEALDYLERGIANFNRETTAPTLSDLGLKYDPETMMLGPTGNVTHAPVDRTVEGEKVTYASELELATPTGPFIKPKEPAAPKDAEYTSPVMCENVTISDVLKLGSTEAERAAVQYVADAVDKLEKSATAPKPEVVETPAQEVKAETPVTTVQEVVSDPQADLFEEFEERCGIVSTVEQATELWLRYRSDIMAYDKAFRERCSNALVLGLEPHLPNCTRQEINALLKDSITKAFKKPEQPPTEPPQPVAAQDDTVSKLVAEFAELENNPKLAEAEVFRVAIATCAVPGKKTTDKERVYTMVREALEIHTKSRNGSVIKGFFPTDSILQDKICTNNGKFKMMCLAGKLPLEK